MMIALIMTIPILISFSIDVCLQFLFVYSNKCQCAGAVVFFLMQVLVSTDILGLFL